MFIAENESKERFCSFELEELFLRSLAKTNSLICPDCYKTVRFRAGTKKPHFFHYTKKCLNPNPYHESETEMHRNGKLLIYNWLKAKFHGYRVELEYYLPETKQRSDVMLISPSGARTAFEFQCSIITGTVWNERHKLYEKAGIQDIWILNHDMKRYAEKHGYQANSLNGLEAAVFNKVKALQYLKVSTQEIMLILMGKNDGRYVYNAIELNSPLDLIYLKDSLCWSDQFQQFLDNYNLQKQLDELDELKYIEEQKRLGEEYRIEKEKEKERAIHNRRSHYINSMEDRIQFSKKFNEKEQQLFNKLFNKYGYTIESFPGLFHIEVQYGDLILTPPQLWQLWLFDRYIVKKFENIKNNELPKIWLEYTIDDFKKLRNEGVFRTINSQNNYSNYTFGIYSYIKILNDAKILGQLGREHMKYQRVLCCRIPTYATHKENLLVKMFFEGYLHESIGQMKKRYLEDIQECHKEAKRKVQNVKPAINVKPESKTKVNNSTLDFIIVQVEKMDVSKIPHNLLFNYFQCITISQMYKKTGRVTEDQYQQIYKFNQNF